MIKILSDFIKSHKYISNSLGKFEIKEQLGQGGTSIVRRAILDDKHEFAIKFLLENIHDEESSAYKRFKQAHINMLTIQNTGAILPQIHFDSLAIDDNTTIPYIVMLKAEKTLRELKNENEMSFELFEKLFKAIINLLKIIHNNGIIHRDLKPENIFILNRKLVIGDFDIAKFHDSDFVKLHDTKEKERLANYFFSAPEQSEKNFEEIKPSADLYAFGQILYWLVTNKTLRGQSSINLVEYDKRYRKYEDIINLLLQHESVKRFQSTDQVLQHLDKFDKTHQDSLEREKKFQALALFDDVINKYTPTVGWQSFKKIDNKQTINDLMNDLTTNTDKLSLWWSKGRQDNNIHYIEKDYGISYFDAIKERVRPSVKWILDGIEIDINTIWIYKYGDVGGSIIIIESKPMSSFGIFKNHYEVEEVALFNKRYVPRSHYDNGWTEYKGKRIKMEKAEIRVRYLHKDIFFVAPWAGSLIGNDQSDSEKVIQRIYNKYREGALLDEKLLEPLKSLLRKSEIVMWS